MNISTLSMVDFIGFAIGFLFTVLVFSYLLGDNPFFRLVVHVFIGVSAAYVAIITVNNVLIPRLILPLISDSNEERLLSILLIIPSLFLLLKATPFRKAGNWTVAILVGIGAATAIGGAITGTLFPQILGTINAVDLDSAAFLTRPWSQFLNGFLVVIGTITTLIYFHFGTKLTPGQAQQRTRFIEIISKVGKLFLAVTFGTLYAGVYLAALAALVERLSFVWEFLSSMGLQIFSS